MHFGTRYRLNASTVAIKSTGNKLVSITALKGETITVTGRHPADDQLIKIRWLGKDLIMFASDLDANSRNEDGQTAKGGR